MCKGVQDFCGCPILCVFCKGWVFSLSVCALLWLANTNTCHSERVTIAFIGTTRNLLLALLSLLARALSAANDFAEFSMPKSEAGTQYLCVLFFRGSEL
jgi:hypothetical protein